MKNLLRVIVVLIIFILGIVLIDKVFVDDKKSEEDPGTVIPVNPEIITFETSFLVDEFVQEYEVIEFTDDEQKEISSLLVNLNYDEVEVDLAFLGEYKIAFKNYEIFFDDNDDSYGLLVDGESSKIINIKSLKDTILKYMAKKDIMKVFLYYRNSISTTDFKRIDISEEDKIRLLNIVDAIKPLQPHEYVNLMVAGEYYLIVDDTILYFDDFPGYIMKEKGGFYDMCYMNDEFIAVMEKYIIEENNECCSCCPDAGPEEACISVCCPCN